MSMSQSTLPSKHIHLQKNHVCTTLTYFSALQTPFYVSIKESSLNLCRYQGDTAKNIYIYVNKV